jgi:AcrR family transcriptional regulator
MKRLQHQKEVQNKILTAALDRFLKQGYTKTTVKQILRDARVTNGTLFHFFPSKEDILMHLVKDVIHGYADMADAMMKKGDPIMRFALEIGLQLHAVIKQEAIGELYLEAYNSCRISKMIVEEASRRNRDLFQSVRSEFNDDDYYRRTLAVKGILHAFINEIVHDKNVENLSRIDGMMEIILSLFNLSGEEIHRTIKKMKRIMTCQSGKISN